jgi:biotin/methionine sulfoxide reductase
MQRAEHGEQTYWTAWALAAALGYIGLPGGGVLMGAGVSKMNTMQRRYLPFAVGTIPQQANPVKDIIPVARVTELLERPGGHCTYNGRTLVFPPIDLVYWVGGNPFHHHQDINRLRRAWTRPKTIITHEINWTTTARLADIVFPCTTALEREDFAGGSMDHWLTPMRRALEPYREARDDYAVFAELARRLGFGPRFTEGRSAQEWVEHLWNVTRANAAAAGAPGRRSICGRCSRSACRSWSAFGRTRARIRYARPRGRSRSFRRPSPASATPIVSDTPRGTRRRSGWAARWRSASPCI